MTWLRCAAILTVAAPLLAAAQFSENAVSLKTATGEIFGTELVPKGGNVAVVLIHAGSGPTDRNGNSALIPGANDSLKMLAEGLARDGIASVRYDKRGIGQSAPASPGEANLRFDHYVDDAADWVTRLKADLRFTKVVVAGHSEGSLIGMLAVNKAGAEGFVSIAGPGRPADEGLRAQLRGRLPPPLYEQSERVLVELKAGRVVTDAPASLSMLYRASVQPYLISWFRHDPAKAIAEVKVPVLIVQGTKDIQVTEDDAKRLAAARPGASLLIMPGMNHVLKTVSDDPADQAASYADPKRPIPADVLEAISGFVKR